MRRTVLTALALAGTAVLLGTGPVFASETATPRPAPTSVEPTQRPEDSAEPTASAEPTRAPAEDTPAPDDEPTRAPAEDQVSVVPSGAPDTGVTPASQASDSGFDGTALGAGAAAVLALGGGTVLVVRRRRATGA
ncbi:sortase-dependent protein [Streptomyces sp. NPDC092370]|uniref:sortase-dependent protein n=1 Tax=Streptomyces sp. NPDC092370 TaxID=3366016 RepID=UPI0038046BCA